MVDICRHHSVAALQAAKNPCVDSTGGWVGSRSDLEGIRKPEVNNDKVRDGGRTANVKHL
jgi:hypothetical protein